MKFTWFNLMPWPDLPDDFRQSHRSVWVDSAGHMAPYEQPDALAAAIVEFAA